MHSRIEVLFCVITEASFAVKARAVKDYCDIYNTKSIAFREGDIIKVSTKYKVWFYWQTKFSEILLLKTCLV